MSEDFRLSDYQILIGKDDVIKRHIHGILSDDPESSENQDKLHGSINWHRCEPDWENPFGLYATFYNEDCHAEDVL